MWDRSSWDISFTARGGGNLRDHYGNWFEVSLKKLKLEVSHDSAILCLGVCLKESMETMARFLHCAATHNGSDMESAWMSINKGMGKENLACTNNGLNKDENYVTYRKTNE